MPIRPSHDDDLPPKWSFDIEGATKTAAIVIRVLVTVLIFAYR
jgi:hypothetical protein